MAVPQQLYVAAVPLQQPAAAAGVQGPGAAAAGEQGPAAAAALEWWQMPYLTPGKGLHWLLCRRKCCRPGPGYPALLPGPF